jgi:hypothetical protein
MGAYAIYNVIFPCCEESWAGKLMSLRPPAKALFLSDDALLLTSYYDYLFLARG